jgi:hypothetical protein
MCLALLDYPHVLAGVFLSVQSVMLLVIAISLLRTSRLLNSQIRDIFSTAFRRPGPGE